MDICTAIACARSPPHEQLLMRVPADDDAAAHSTTYGKKRRQMSPQDSNPREVRVVLRKRSMLLCCKRERHR
eukprot:2350754-Pleurochrysis_carterae.AAC.1